MTDDEGGRWIGCLVCRVPLRFSVSRERLRLTCPKCKRSWEYGEMSPVEEDELPPFVAAHYRAD
jgi:hypothetical protein